MKRITGILKEDCTNIYFDFNKNNEIIFISNIIEKSDAEEMINQLINDDKEDLKTLAESKKSKKHAISKEIQKGIDNFNTYDYIFTPQPTIVNPLGTLLIDFLNIDLSNYNDFANFMNKYGISSYLFYLDFKKILEETDRYLTYVNKENLNKELKQLYKINISEFKTQQKYIRDGIDYIFNYNNDTKTNSLTIYERFFVLCYAMDSGVDFRSFFSQKYRDQIELYRDIPGETHELEYFFMDKDRLINTILQKGLPKFSDSIYLSQNFISMVYLSIQEICKTEKVIINKCLNCGKYFLPKSRIDEKYCTNQSPQNTKKTCREYGAQVQYNKSIKQNEAMTLYRKIYHKKLMQSKRNKDNNYNVQKIFDSWKIKAKDKRNEYVHGYIEKEKFIKWLKDND